LFHDHKGFQLQLSEQEAQKDLIYFPMEKEVADRSSWMPGAAVMVVRHGCAKTFCGACEEKGDILLVLFLMTTSSLHTTRTAEPHQ
jgi:hypothetical protein